LATRFVSEGGTDTYEVACGLSWSGIWTNLYQNFEAFKKFGIGYSGAPYGCHSILCLMCAKCKMFIFKEILTNIISSLLWENGSPTAMVHNS
jgi:hypothetical protein